VKYPVIGICVIRNAESHHYVWVHGTIHQPISCAFLSLVQYNGRTSTTESRTVPGFPSLLVSGRSRSPSIIVHMDRTPARSPPLRPVFATELRLPPTNTVDSIPLRLVAVYPEKRIAGSVPRGNANGVGASEGAAAGQEQEGNDIKPKKKSSKKGKGAAKAAKKQQTAEEELERDVLAAGQMDEELARDMQNVSIDDVNVTAGDEEEEGDDQDDEEDGEEDMEGEVPQDEATRPVDPDSDNDIPEEPEIVPQRDSIFISGRNKSTPNVVADWSFVDVDALAAAALDGPPASNAPSNNSNCTTTSKTPFSNK
jgi:hypothetical protein